MQITKTTFDINRHHIHLECAITDNEGIKHSFNGILDSGAPRTEFSDLFLLHTGLLTQHNPQVDIPPGLQSQKHSKINIPLIEICNQQLIEFEVYVATFESSWGIDALIGLDFFRRFQLTIDYNNGLLISKPYSPQ